MNPGRMNPPLHYIPLYDIHILLSVVFSLLFTLRTLQLVKTHLDYSKPLYIQVGILVNFIFRRVNNHFNESESSCENRTTQLTFETSYLFPF